MRASNAQNQRRKDTRGSESSSRPAHSVVTAPTAPSQEVLGKVKRLAERVKAEPEVAKTLADLNLPHSCREVVDKGADAVLDEIETAILAVASTILLGEGFAYELPNRSKGNQLYVPGEPHDAPEEGAPMVLSSCLMEHDSLSALITST